MDGTFKTAPQPFTQVYNIHGLVNGRTITCVYALLKNKTQDTYNKLFEKLASFNTYLNPSSIMIDFELAVLNSLQNVFPESELRVCFFH